MAYLKGLRKNRLFTPIRDKYEMLAGNERIRPLARHARREKTLNENSADVKTHPSPGLMWKASKTPNEIRTPPVCLGEHNEYVYKEIPGVSDETYARLERNGHIGTEPAPGVT